MIRILVADDSSVSRATFSGLLGREPDFEVVATATDGMEAVQKVRDLLPDVVIMDALMPNMDGLEATAQIKEEHPHAGVLLYSAFVVFTEQRRAAGADGYLLKSCEREWLFSEVRRIAAKMREAKAR